MSRVLNARIPFLTKKRSFDLAWGAWAGILAVMTAVGAALAGAQMVMMYPRQTDRIVFKYPSMPRSAERSTEQLDKDTVTFFWGSQGVVFGRMSDVTAPQGVGQLNVVQSNTVAPSDLQDELESWSKVHLKQPVKVVAIAESARGEGSISFSEISELAAVFQSLNRKMFAVDVKPAIVPVDLANPI